MLLTVRFAKAKVQFVNLSQTLSHFLSCLRSNFLSQFLAHFLSQLSPLYFSPSLSPTILLPAIYCQYSLIIRGQSLDSSNYRGAPPSCSICRGWYLGRWFPCRSWRPPCPPGSRPGREARQERKGHLDPQGRLELIWS